MTSLDLGTVLFLHKTSLMAGAFALMVLWRRAGRPPAVAMIGSAFALLALGAVLAGLGEWKRIPPFVWRDTSAGLGVGAYTLLFLGLRRLDRAVGRLRWLLLATPAILALGLVTPIFAEDRLRATLFHLAGALAPLAAGLGLLSGHRSERLPSRRPLAGCLLACGAVYAAQVPLLVAGWATPGTLALGFAATMTANFAIAALVVSFVRERREEVHRRVSMTDALTGVPNRQGFLALVPDELAAGAALAILDLDHFKQVNDRFGHAGGDHALSSFARLAERHLRRGEVLARIGGEEFVLSLPAGEPSRGLALAEEIRRSLRHADIRWLGQAMPISVSVGLAVAPAGAPCTREALLARADAALYRAKADGRNRVILSETDERPRATATLHALPLRRAAAR